MTESLGAIFEGTAGTVALRHLTLPDPGAGEYLVRVLGCTLCGSDLHSFDGRRSVPVPTVLGHEIVGEIVACGSPTPTFDLAGAELKPGDRVTWAIVASCGNCFYCLRELPQKCQHAVKYGHEPLRPGRELLGGLAEHCLLVAGTALIRLPDLPLSVACPASCATATIAAAIEAAGTVKDRSICIFGAGMLGLTACAMADSLGASRIVCVEPNAGRRDRARRFGATDVADAKDLFALTRETGIPEGFDAVLELSGATAAFDVAWPLIRIGGVLVLVGSVFPTPPVPIALEQVVRRHLTIRGIHNYAPRHLKKAVEFLTDAHRKYPFAELVADWFPLSDIETAFARAMDPGVIRIGVAPTAR